MVAGLAAANGAFSLRKAFRILTIARRWIARISDRFVLRVAKLQGISCGGGRTRTHRMVALDMANGTDAARSRTRVTTAVANARLTVGALFIDAALKAVAANTRAWVTGQSIGTLTRRLSVGQDDAMRIRTAGVRFAHRSRWLVASNVGVTQISGSAVALLLLVHHVAVGVDAAWAGGAKFLHHNWNFTLSEGISNVGLGAVTHRIQR